jgi:hypothetical protein
LTGEVAWDVRTGWTAQAANGLVSMSPKRRRAGCDEGVGAYGVAVWLCFVVF